ncbi:PadR family transcriptional regulator [Yinghuangia aomiensis]
MRLRFSLLGLLAMGSQSGYELQKWLNGEGAFLGLDRHPSQVYRELNKMHGEGLIDFDVDPRQGSGPDAKVYRPTAEGLEQLRRWVQSPYESHVRVGDPQFGWRLVFAAPIDRRRALEIARQELDFRIKQVAATHGRDRSVVRQNPAPGVNPDAWTFLHDQLHGVGMQLHDQWIASLRALVALLENAGWDTPPAAEQ